MLDSLSDLYSELEMISVSVSMLSFCLTSHFLLTTSTTNYYFKKNIYNSNLRKLFYSRQGLKDTCCSLIYTGHKRADI